MLGQELHNLNDDVYSGLTINCHDCSGGYSPELDMNTTCTQTDLCETRTNALIDQVTREVEVKEIDPRWAALKKIQLKSE